MKIEFTNCGRPVKSHVFIQIYARDAYEVKRFHPEI